MPLPQRNFDYFTYESGDGTNYNLRVASEWAAITAHGLAARANGQPRLIASAQHRPRSVKYTDLTTGRSVQGPIGTAAAWTAIDIGDTQAFPVPGQTATVTYTVTSKREEKVPTSVAATHLPDHA